jgi:hypothetical protein
MDDLARNLHLDVEVSNVGPGISALLPRLNTQRYVLRPAAASSCNEQ